MVRESDTIAQAHKACLDGADTITSIIATHNKGSDATIEDFAHDQEVSWPITSIRRAITDLTNAGKLTKTDTMKLGRYGKHVHTWKLA